MIDLNVRIDPLEEGLLLNAILFCNDAPVIEFNNFPNEEGSVNIKLPLNFNTINQANGNCYFAGTYDGETRKSMNFEISKLLIVRLSSDAFFVNPGEEIIISGSAEKLNGKVVDGEIEIRIPLLEILPVETIEDTGEENSEEETDEESEEETDEESEEETDEESDEETEEEADEESDEETEDGETEEAEEGTEEETETIDFNAGIFYDKVVGGDFSVTINIPENAPAGDYRIDALVYEGNEDQRSSEGISYANLKVFQILKKIDLRLNNQNFDPGTIIEVRPYLLDQTGVNIDDEVSVIIKNELGERFYEKIVQSQEGLNYEIPKNFASGYYEVLASNGETEIIKKIFINQKAIVSFELVEDTLIVTNIGNIPYKKGIEIELGGKPFVKLVELELGESTSFKLTGDDGEYDVKISDGNSELFQSGISLTGRAIDVNQIGKGINFGGPMFWIFLFIILILILLFIFRKVLKKKSFAFHMPKIRRKKQVSEFKTSTPIANKTTSSKNISEIKKTDSKGNVIHNQADQVLVLKGHKAHAAILVIKIKNKLEDNEKKSLEHAMESVYNKKGAVYEQGDFIFAMFSPLMTNVKNNEAVAAKVAEEIAKTLNDHNQKFKNPIDFGIAINSGEIINKIENDKLKFTALGNFVVSAKRLAESSDKQVLLSKESFQKAGSEVKAEKVSDGQAYNLRRVVDSEKNNKFIQVFLERQPKG